MGARRRGGAAGGGCPLGREGSRARAGVPGVRGGRGGSGPAAASPSPAPARCPGPPLPPAPPGPRTLRSPQDSGPPPPPQPRGGLPTPTSRLPSHLGARPGRCGAETLSVAVGRDGDSGPSLPASGCGTRVPAPVPEARAGAGPGLGRRQGRARAAGRRRDDKVGRRGWGAPRLGLAAHTRFSEPRPRRWVLPSPLGDCALLRATAHRPAVLKGPAPPRSARGARMAKG